MLAQTERPAGLRGQNSTRVPERRLGAGGAVDGPCAVVAQIICSGAQDGVLARVL